STWGDPSDITDVVWQAGYRKPERGEKEIAELIIDIMNGVPDQVPYSARPKNLKDILSMELNDIITYLENSKKGRPQTEYRLDATWGEKLTPAGVAKMILESGYQKGGNNGTNQ
ncbi:hypothetical protein ID850_05550, partial [Xenorhabdus sp. Flor]|uniref:hypothetical protein n=1 Tax=Xenorhabdus cabanillasii TaxID=351673 RepID=UPI001986F9F1